MSLEAVFSAMRLSRSSSKDSKLAGPWRPPDRVGLEGVPSPGCSGVSAATGERSCAVSMGEDWVLGTDGLDGMEEVVRDWAFPIPRTMRPVGFQIWGSEPVIIRVSEGALKHSDDNKVLDGLDRMRRQASSAACAPLL